MPAKARRRLEFPTISQLLTPKFPTYPNREFCRANRELFPAEQAIIQLINADGVFGTHNCRLLSSPRRRSEGGRLQLIAVGHSGITPGLRSACRTGSLRTKWKPMNLFYVVRRSGLRNTGLTMAVWRSGPDNVACNIFEGWKGLPL